MEGLLAGYTRFKSNWSTNVAAVFPQKLNTAERKQEWAPFHSTRMTMEPGTSTKMSLGSVKLYCVYFASINFSNVGQFSWSLILNDSIKSSSERETNIQFPHKTSHQEVPRLKVRSHGWPEEFLTGWKFVRLGVPSQHHLNRTNI